MSSENQRHLTQQQLFNLIKNLQEDYFLAFITKDQAIKEIMSCGIKKTHAKELFEII